MNLKKRLFNKRNGFTLIELIVVIAVIGILVLLAAPKFLGYVERTQVTRILHDTKVVDNKVEETLAMNKEAFDEEELNHTEFLSLINEGKVFGLNGKVIESNKDLIITDTYKKISPEIIKASKTGLKGNFYLGSGGKMYYEHTKSIGDNTDPVDPIDPVDKTELINKIQEAKDLSEDDYVEGWENLLQAIQQAEVVNKTNATEAEVSIAIENIGKAIEGLKEKLKIPGPSPSKPIKGATDGTYTFYGEVSPTDFISGSALASNIGLTAGTAYNNDEPWLKFTRKNEAGQLITMFVAKKPLRHTLSRSSIDNVGAVFGTKTIVIDGNTYKVRLMKGANKDLYSNHNTDIHGSEWNKMMLPIHEKASLVNPGWNSPGGVGPNDTAYFAHGLGTGGGGYTNGDLGITNMYSWMQETYSKDTSNGLVIGYDGVSNSNGYTASVVYPYVAWRPVLELMD